MRIKLLVIEKLVVLCSILLVSIPNLFYSQSKVTYSIYIDSSNSTFENIQDKNFTHLKKASINLGFTNLVPWLKIEFKEPSKNRGLILSSLNSVNDSISAYITYHSGEIKIMYFGTLIKSNIGNYQNPLAIELNDTISSIYIRTKSHSFVRDEFKIGTIIEYHNNKLIKFIQIGIVMGVFFFMFIYNISLYIKLKENAYLFYSIYILSMFVMIFYIEGIGNLYIWRNYPLLNLYIEPIFLGIAVFGLSYYSNIVLKIKVYFKPLHILIKSIGLIGLALIPATFLISPLVSSQIAGLLPFFCMISIFIASLIAIFNKDKYAQFFLLGWTIFMITATGRILYNMDIINYTPIIDFINYCGSIFEAIVFTWVISRYLNQEQEKNTQIQIRLNQYSQQLDELKNLLKTTSKQDLPLDVEEAIKINFDLTEYLKVPLSEREQEVLKELTKGLTYQQIAENLFISKNTVKTHILNIYDKLDVNNRTEAINKAQNLQLT